MRLVYFSREYTVHDHRFLSALVKSDFQVYYLHLEKRPHPLEERKIPAGVTQVEWAGGRKPFRWSYFPSLLVDLKRVLDKIQPDLIQAGPIQTAALLVALTGYQPLISMSWGYDLLIDAERNFLWRWATRYALRKSAVMLGDCNTIRQKAISYGMADERIVTFPWGIDLEQFSPGEERPGGDTVTLLSTRSWEPIYGIDVMAEAFVIASRTHPSLRLVMLSDGSMKDQLVQYFDKAGVLNKVSFPGRIGQAELPPFYRQADLYMCASHSDGTSISLLEALACGKPVIMSDIPGHREWVMPGIQGWLFPDGNPQALAHVIVEAVNHRDKLKEMGQAARQLAEERADWNKHFPELFKAHQMAFQYAQKYPKPRKKHQ